MNCLKSLLLALIISQSFILFAQDNRTVTVYGSDHEYELTAPEKWSISTSKGIKRGMMVVAYPEGANVQKAPVIMYSNSSHLNEQQKTVNDLIAYDIAEFKKNSPGIMIPHGNDINLSSGETAIIYTFSGGTEDHHEAVAYIGEDHIVVLIVLACNTEEELKSNYPVFEEFVRSFRWLGEYEK